MDVDKPTFTINILLFSPNYNPSSKIVPCKLPLSDFTDAIGESEDVVKEKFSKWGLKSIRGRFEWWKPRKSLHNSTLRSTFIAENKLADIADKIQPVTWYNEIFSTVKDIPPHVVHFFVTEGEIGGRFDFENIYLPTPSYVRRVQNLGPPSSAAGNSALLHQVIVTGRGLEQGPPITIFEPIFARLYDDLANIGLVHPNLDIYHKVANFCNAMAGYYPSEDFRIARTQSLFHEVLGLSLDRLPSVPVVGLHKNKHSSGATPDYRAAVRCGEHTLVFFIEEDKNELGVGGDPVSQAALDYCKLVLHDECRDVINVSRCPTILVTIAGEYISIHGAITLRKCILQPFIEHMSMSCTPFRQRTLDHLVRMFTAVKFAVQSLRDQYSTLTPDNLASPSRLLPSPMPLDEASQVIVKAIRFTSQLSQQHFVYRGRYNDEDVLIKFCDKYCEDAHKLLASQVPPLAPRMYFCEQISGGSVMVVIEYIETLDVHERSLLLPTIRQDVLNAKGLLHNNGFVHGDLRIPNILVERTSHRVMLCDFDWAGREGEARYPFGLNPTIPWPVSPPDGLLIKREYDDIMFESLFGT